MNRLNVCGVFGAAVALSVAAGCSDVVDGSAPLKQSIEFQEGAGEFMPGYVGYGYWFGDELHQMHEPRLYRARMPEGMTIIRLLWIRSFDPSVAVRIVETAECCVVTTTILELSETIWAPPDSQGFMMAIGTRPGRILRRDSSEFAVGRCAEVHARAVGAGLWSGPVTDRVAGLDGDEVVFELASSSGYRVSHRWGPDSGRAKEFREMAGVLLGMVGVNGESGFYRRR